MSDRSNFHITPDCDKAKAAAQRWQAFDGRGLKAPADCIDFAVVDLSTGKEIARVWEEADARRLAAFPDLLEALKLVLPLAKGYAPEGQSDTAKRTCREWVERAEAAISRAEGQGT